jgi:hypothetical protein
MTAPSWIPFQTQSLAATAARDSFSRDEPPSYDLWGAPRIHGELLKLGIAISQATVAKYMTGRRPSSPTWRT